MLLAYCCRFSCFYLNVCSLWLSFGVFVTGVLFQTTTCVSFLLISLGYCITCELLTVSERRRTSILGCVFYLTLVGYRASVPYFSVSLLTWATLNISRGLISTHSRENNYLLWAYFLLVRCNHFHRVWDFFFSLGYWLKHTSLATF